MGRGRVVFVRGGGHLVAAPLGYLGGRNALQILEDEHLDAEGFWVLTERADLRLDRRARVVERAGGEDGVGGVPPVHARRFGRRFVFVTQHLLLLRASCRRLKRLELGDALLRLDELARVGVSVAVAPLGRRLVNIRRRVVDALGATHLAFFGLFGHVFGP